MVKAVHMAKIIEIKIYIEQEAVMKQKLSWIDKIMAAVTFAEANEQNVAKEFLTGTGRKSERKQRCKECGEILSTDLHGAKVH
jgi:uncharacterized protein with PIN domain